MGMRGYASHQRLTCSAMPNCFTICEDDFSQAVKVASTIASMSVPKCPTKDKDYLFDQCSRTAGMDVLVSAEDRLSVF